MRNFDNYEKLLQHIEAYENRDINKNSHSTLLFLVRKPSVFLEISDQPLGLNNYDKLIIGQQFWPNLSYKRRFYPPLDCTIRTSLAKTF